ncbi:MAG: leucine--tRNA ligase [Candidatus Woesearchaeota archaeon]|jgi:leucyl-tRNA synthetase
MERTSESSNKSERLDLNHEEITKKWQKRWAHVKLGEVERDNSKKKFFMIWAYATVSGFQHTGHMRGYSYADAICRYKRMNGYNVLLPAGGHATGNGAIAKAQKIKQKDQQWINEFQSRGLTDIEIEKISEPESFVEYFAKTYIQDYKQFGFLGDWRRFILTTTPDYKKFIEWQFHKLHEKNLLVQKPYFATACENCGPVSVDPSEMDLSKGGNAEVNEYTLIKLNFEQPNQFIVCATLRPETMYGQTNIWVDPNITYSKILVNNEIWIVSKEATKKIAYQKDDAKVVGSINAKDMIGKYCLAPMINRQVMILPSKFCDPNIGTGIVTSVPSDAPHDWMGLHDLQLSVEECNKYNINHEDILKIKPIAILKTPGFGDYPAIEICEKLGIKNQNDPKLEDAKKEIYKLGFNFGVMNENCGPYAGQKVTVAKDIVKEDLISSGNADMMQDLSEEVICRCNGQVFIKKVDGQWFIKYSDEYLTNQSKKHAVNMNIVPQNYYDNITETLDWFKDRPCARQGRWLGTTFPFDKSYIIEAISDSTLYPIYYLVSKYVNEQIINETNLTLEFFDYVFLGIGNITSVSSKTNVSELILKQIKDDVEYWYPLDINLGGKEHRRVHFPPFIMNHVAILQEKYWPKGIFINEWVMQGKNQKLSKSKGGAQPIPDVSEHYSVDAMRLYYANIASPFVDIYFNEEDILMYKQRLERIYYFFKELTEITSTNKCVADDILISKSNRRLIQVKEYMDSFDFKKATDIIYVDLFRDLQNYRKMKGENKNTLNEVLEIWAKTMIPFTPHIAEECWELLNTNTLASTETWPITDESKINLESELTEELLQNTLGDIREVQKLAKIDKPKKAALFISEPWKYEFYSLLKSQFETTKDFKTIIDAVMKYDSLKQNSKEITKLIPSLIKKGLPDFMENQEKEFECILAQIKIIQEDIGCEIEIIKSQESVELKAKNASPSKPAIILI